MRSLTPEKLFRITVQPRGFTSSQDRLPLYTRAPDLHAKCDGEAMTSFTDARARSLAFRDMRRLVAVLQKMKIFPVAGIIKG